MASHNGMEEQDSVNLSDIKIEIDVAEECWCMSELHPPVPASKSVATKNTATMPAVLTLGGQAAVSTHTDTWLKQDLQTPETQTAVSTHTDTWLKQEMQTPKAQTAVSTHSDTWLKQEMQTPETRTAVNTHSNTWLKQEMQTPETQTSVSTHNIAFLVTHKRKKKQMFTQSLLQHKSCRVLPPRGKKRKACTVQERLHAIERCKKGDSRSSIVRDLGISNSTLRGWLGSEDKLRSFINIIDTSVGLKRLRTTGAFDKKLDAAVFQWFTRECEKGTTITGPIIQEQAGKLRSKVYREDKSSPVSEGWVNRFKRRHAIIAANVCGEVKYYLKGFRTLLEDRFSELGSQNVKADQVNKTDETGLCYKAGPCKMLAVRKSQEKADHACDIQLSHCEGIGPANRYIHDAEGEDCEDTAAERTDNQIVDALVNDNEDVADSTTDSRMGSNSPRTAFARHVTAREAVAGMETALRWFEEQDSDIVQLTQLRSLLSTARSALASSRSQLDITDSISIVNIGNDAWLK
ncbi:uncharacterized protein [Littorina saxatilis]|uniref:uncharacterized protein n=1 Tax=Littorina saxatilis TaxID=31220 RepID=UPI0038B50EEA